MRKTSSWVAVALSLVMVGCGGGDSEPTTTDDTGKGKGQEEMTKAKTYAEDVAFLKEHVDVIELGGGDGPALVVVPAYQGRVMTSTVDAAKGDGIGFIKYDVVEKGTPTPGMTAYGGEDRIWLGPE